MTPSPKAIFSLGTALALTSCSRQTSLPSQEQTPPLSSVTQSAANIDTAHARWLSYGPPSDIAAAAKMISTSADKHAASLPATDISFFNELDWSMVADALRVSKSLAQATRDLGSTIRTYVAQNPGNPKEFTGYLAFADTQVLCNNAAYIEALRRHHMEFREAEPACGEFTLTFVLAYTERLIERRDTNVHHFTIVNGLVRDPQYAPAGTAHVWLHESIPGANDRIYDAALNPDYLTIRETSGLSNYVAIAGSRFTVDLSSNQLLRPSGVIFRVPNEARANGEVGR